MPSNKTLPKPVAVITGAASGIGLELAKKCLQTNRQVVLADYNADALHARTKELSAVFSTDVLGVVCDVSQLESVRLLAEKVFDQFGRVDLLINNAGISGRLAPLWELPHEAVQNVINTNLYGVIHGAQVFLPLMFEQSHRSQMVNMASVYGLCSGSCLAAYAMSKQAVVALTESLYFDLKRLNKPVDVSVICPSFADTPLLAHSAPSDPDKLHEVLSALMSHSRPADDLADYILREIDKRTVYILPDQEVKGYCEQRAKAIVDQTTPHVHGLEKVIAALSQRVDNIA